MLSWNNRDNRSQEQNFFLLYQLQNLKTTGIPCEALPTINFVERCSPLNTRVDKVRWIWFDCGMNGLESNCIFLFIYFVFSPGMQQVGAGLPRNASILSNSPHQFSRCLIVRCLSCVWFVRTIDGCWKNELNSIWRKVYSFPSFSITF